jgi:transposase
MAEVREAFVGIDVAKLRNAVAVADAGRDGEVRYFGEVDASPDSRRRLAAKLAAKYDRLTFCYEAGPTGYGLYRLLTELGHGCIVVAPSLIPKKPSNRVKTNRRDALTLARLLRAGELTAVWVPDTAHEAMRNLVRARAATVKDVGLKKRQVSAFLLRHSRIFPRKKNWGARYRGWLQTQSFDHVADQIVLQESIEAVRLAEERLVRIERAIEEFLPTWSLAPLARPGAGCGRCSKASGYRPGNGEPHGARVEARPHRRQPRWEKPCRWKARCSAAAASGPAAR